MEESVSKILSYIVFTLSIVAGVMLLLMRVDNTRDTAVRNFTTSFVDECRTTGQITPDNYKELYTTIYKLGDYTITLEHEQKVTYPNPDGTIRTEWTTVNSNDILTAMYGAGISDQLDYSMDTGDRFTVTVKRNSASISSKMLTWFTGGVTDQGTIIVKYSGTVGSYGG